MSSTDRDTFNCPDDLMVKYGNETADDKFTKRLNKQREKVRST